MEWSLKVFFCLTGELSNLKQWGRFIIPRHWKMLLTKNLKKVSNVATTLEFTCILLIKAWEFEGCYHHQYCNHYHF